MGGPREGSTERGGSGARTTVMRTTVAAGAGVCAAALSCGAVLAFISGGYLGYSYTMEQDPQATVALSLLLSFVLAPVLAVAGGALVGRALGMGWGRVWVASFAALVAGILLSGQMSLRLLYTAARIEGPFASPALAAVFMALLVVLAAVLSGGVSINSRRVPVLVAGIAVPIVLAMALVSVIWLTTESAAAVIGSGIAAWVLLPVAAALVLTSTDRRRT